MRYLILAALALFGLTAAGQREAAFRAGEKLTFNVGHSYVKGASVIGVTFSTSATVVDGHQTHKVQTVGKTLTGYRTFFDLNDTYETWLDVGTLRPVRFANRLQENKYRFQANYSYNWDAGTVTTRYRKLTNPVETRRTLKLQPGTGDAIAILYNLRCDDIASFRVGERRTMRLVLDDTVRTLTYRYMGREVKKIGRLGTFNTLKIICSMASSSDPDAQVFAEGSELTLWLSDDKNHMPLAVESPIKFGSIVATLTKFEGLKYPLTSKTK